MKKYSKEDLLEMTKNFGYGTPARKEAKRYAKGYDWSDWSLNSQEACEDSFIYGISWALEHLK